MTSFPPPPAAPMYQPPMGYPSDYPNGTLILVFGILSLICCAPLGIPAWVMGRSALKDIDRSGIAYGNRGTIKAGMVCGIIGTCLLVGIVLLWAALFVVGISTGDMHSTTYSN